MDAHNTSSSSLDKSPGSNDSNNTMDEAAKSNVEFLRAFNDVAKLRYKAKFYRKRFRVRNDVSKSLEAKFSIYKYMIDIAIESRKYSTKKNV